MTPRVVILARLLYNFMMNQERYAKLNTALMQILSILQTKYKPEKVILFGSMAHGNVDEWSDLDLCIIKETPLPFLKRLKEVALLCDASVGVDYLVYTAAELEEMVHSKNPFVLEEILDKGKILYESQPATALV